MRVRFALAAAVMSFALSVAAQTQMHVVHAKGSFDIKMNPAESSDFEKANDITRSMLPRGLLLVKRAHHRHFGGYA